MFNRKMRLFLIIVVLTTVLGQWIMNNPPESTRRGKPNSANINVQVETVNAQLFQAVIESFGTVQPRTQSFLVSQITGQIMQVSSHFRVGAFFKKGDVLVQIDPRDYQAEVDIAKASLLTAQQGLMEEQARGEQALQDWQRLGGDETPSDLVLRKPQLASAEANVLSAKARLRKAEIALSRTNIIAPFDGRILRQLADVGQVVGGNAQLAEVYATDVVEVRLPINNHDLSLLTLPERYDDGSHKYTDTPVTFHSEMLGDQHWAGILVRTESAIDASAQQLYVVAQIHEPFAPSAGTTMKMGQYVTAKIQGKQVRDAVVIPNKAIYQGSYVYVEIDGLLQRRDIDISWQNDTQTLLHSGLQPNDHLVVTPLGQVNSGTPVIVTHRDGQQIVKPERDKKARKQGKRGAIGKDKGAPPHKKPPNKEGKMREKSEHETARGQGASS